MKSDKILDAMEFISDDKILDARQGRVFKLIDWMKIVSLAACICLVVAGGIIGFRYALNQIDDNSDAAAGNELPGGITPSIFVNGKLYYWTGISCIPNTFVEIGSISSITEAVPTEELQLQAGFAAEGTVYISPDYPEVVYIRMTTDWFYDQGVRFVTKELGDTERISYQNRQYRMEYGSGEIIEKLPEGCIWIGNLRFIGRDSIPQDDLETNVPNDSHSDEPMEGREVYMDLNDNSVLYVAVHKYSREGMDIVYQVCRLWNE